MNETTKKLLRLITGGKADFGGAYSIRENGKCADMRSSETSKSKRKPTSRDWISASAREQRAKRWQFPPA